MKNYIFGYGSLIERESRLRTTPNAKAVFPVQVNGFKRGWFARTNVSGLTTTFLGCVEDLGSHTNGVIYEVNENDLLETDKRERGYERIKINFKDIEDYSSQLDRSATVWIYANKFTNDKIPESNFPSKDFPIVQSYVDICLNGCLEIEAAFPIAKENNFAIDFIKSTKYWSKFWVNDRIYPRRPFIYRPTAYKIDRLLQENLSDKTLFNQIYFE